MATKYQCSPDPGLVRPGFKSSPLSAIVVTSQGTVAKPVPPTKPKFSRALKPAPVPVKAPGASGTI